MGIRSTCVRGMRFTDKPTMDVVEMVLGGKVNKAIVAQINRHGGKSVGLSGKDADLIKAEKMQIVAQDDASKPPEIVDPGMVGRVTQVNPAIIHTLTREGFIPVIAPVGIGEEGETYNINADLVASRMAIALQAGRLILMTDVDGVLDDRKTLISSIDAATVRDMIAARQVTGGMIPKLECALEAIGAGVAKVPIINGKRRHAILLELFTDQGIGTEVTL
jgi:acetylglutamate kinase